MIRDFRRVLAQSNGTSQGIAASETTPQQRRMALIQLIILLNLIGISLYYFTKQS